MILQKARIMESAEQVIKPIKWDKRMRLTITKDFRNVRVKSSYTLLTYSLYFISINLFLLKKWNYEIAYQIYITHLLVLFIAAAQSSQF